MSECVSEMFWCFFKQDYVLFAPAGRLMEMFFEHTEHTLWRKISAYWSCIVIFLAEVCFVCSGEASRRDIPLSTQTMRFGFVLFVCLI